MNRIGIYWFIMATLSAGVLSQSVSMSLLKETNCTEGLIHGLDNYVIQGEVHIQSDQSLVPGIFIKKKPSEELKYFTIRYFNVFACDVVNETRHNESYCFKTKLKDTYSFTLFTPAHENDSNASILTYIAYYNRSIASSAKVNVPSISGNCYSKDLTMQARSQVIVSRESPIPSKGAPQEASQKRRSNRPSPPNCSFFANLLSNDMRTRSAFLACNIDILCGVKILFKELNDDSHAAVETAKIGKGLQTCHVHKVLCPVVLTCVHCFDEHEGV
ncbi:hypothetical protein Btru_009306 [Bulinus truncatus]|nr:hypothetical protein Btru_009306 [Bulinus truncatus]